MKLEGNCTLSMGIQVAHVIAMWVAPNGNNNKVRVGERATITALFRAECSLDWIWGRRGGVSEDWCVVREREGREKGKKKEKELLHCWGGKGWEQKRSLC